MKQHFTDEKTGIRYTLQGDYYLPDLALPAEEQQPIGIWGQRHLRHIKQNQRVLYTNLLTSGKLNSYLADIEQHAVQQVRNPFHHHLLTDKLNSNPVFIRHRLQVSNYALCQLVEVHR